MEKVCFGWAFPLLALRHICWDRMQFRVIIHAISLHVSLCWTPRFLDSETPIFSCTLVSLSSLNLCVVLKSYQVCNSVHWSHLSSFYVLHYTPLLANGAPSHTPGDVNGVLLYPVAQAKNTLPILASVSLTTTSDPSAKSTGCAFKVFSNFGQRSSDALQ